MTRIRHPLIKTAGLSDSLNNTWTVVILLGLSFITFWMQVYTEPINCITGKEMPKSESQFANQRCWYSTKYYLAMEEVSLKEAMKSSFPQEAANKAIYQWFPLMLLFQALLFKLPNIVWSASLRVIGISFPNLCGISDGNRIISCVERKLVGKQLAEHLYNYVKNRPCTCITCPSLGVMTLLNSIVKLLYFTNALSQYFVLYRYLTNGDLKYLLQPLLLWDGSAAFPTRILCIYSFRLPRILHKWTVHCDVTINHWYNKIAVCVLIWILIMVIVTSLSCAVNVVKFLLPCTRKR